LFRFIRPLDPFQAAEQSQYIENIRLGSDMAHVHGGNTMVSLKKS